jgi:hypothetical protein
MFNLTARGAIDYITDILSDFKIRELLDYGAVVSRAFNVGMTTSKLAGVFGTTPDIGWQKKLSMCPTGKHACQWWSILYHFVKQFVDLHYPSSHYIDADTRHFMHRLYRIYPDLNIGCDKQNLIDFCTMVLMNNVVHELYGNPILSVYVTNPFVQSLSWKENASTNVTDHLSNLQNQLHTNITFTRTIIPSKRLIDDFTHLCTGKKETLIFQNFQRSLRYFAKAMNKKGDVSTISHLHPFNVECSVRW